MNTLVGVASVLAVPCLACGCAAVQPRVFTQPVKVHVESGARAPISGASVFVNGELAVKTTPEGLANVSVNGVAGDKFRLSAGCPDGFRSVGPEVQQDIYVTPGIWGGTPELIFRCELTRRRATVVVRAENGSNLPIRHLGREVGRTDPRGAATVYVEAEQGDSFEIVLDTSNAKNLHPQNPAITFQVKESKESFVFDQKFTVEKTIKVRAKAPAVPIRIAPSHAS
jgi:hypothetical protein